MINQENWNYCFYENADGQIASLGSHTISNESSSDATANNISHLYSFMISMDLEEQKYPLILLEKSFEHIEEALLCINALPQSYPEDNWVFVSPKKKCGGSCGSGAGGCGKCCAQKKKRS